LFVANPSHPSPSPPQQEKKPEVKKTQEELNTELESYYAKSKTAGDAAPAV